jgi:hypothetical protein
LLFIGVNAPKPYLRIPPIIPYQPSPFRIDKERHALFYVIAGCLDLWVKEYCFYDFEERVIRPDNFVEVDLSGGIRDC